MGLLPARRGRISFLDRDVTRASPDERARAGLGYVPQGRRVFASLDVVDNLTVAARRSDGDGAGEPWDLDRIWKMFPRLYERRTNEAGQLSGGEQQMLAIARALMTRPTLLIMDEPSEGLAPMILENVGEQLRRLKGGALSMLLVEQNVALAIALADLVYVLEKGEVVFRGAPDDLDSDEEVKRRYLGVGV
jgi:branched-chain amino acid transport system ATP-binding protein